MFNRRCMQCDTTVMPMPFMICDECSKKNDYITNLKRPIQTPKVQK